MPATSGTTRGRVHVREPRIPLAVVDAPTQRFYAAAAFFGVQAWKWMRLVAVHWFHAPRARGMMQFFEPTSFFVVLLLDFSLCYALHWLAIPPRATGTPASAVAPPQQAARTLRRPWTAWHYVGLFLILAAADAIVLLPYDDALAWVPAVLPGPAVWSVGERRVRLDHIVRPRAHISGQHTIHIVPYGTAHFAPATTCMCLGENVREVHIPVVFNQTVPASLTYSITDPVSGHKSVHTIKHPKTSAQTRARAPGTEAQEPDVPRGAHVLSLAERKRARQAAKQRASDMPVETVHDLRITHTGILQLESVVDRQANEALVGPETVTLVECPRASFVHGASDYCMGEEALVEVMLHGTPPLSLEYELLRGSEPPKQIQHQHTLLHHSPHMPATIALGLPLPGTQTVRLKSVRDACGNAAALQDAYDVQVHAQAQVHFDPMQCVPGRPLKLLRTSPGLDVRVQLQQAGPSDAWDVQVVHRPDGNATTTWKTLAPGGGRSRQVVWTLERGTHTKRLDQTGLYTIEGLSSQFCAGQVGSPWTCEVVDVPLPRASIHFESIEDPCAGTVGVKALSDLEGEPPFRLVYETQRAGQAPRRHERVVRDQTRDELEFWPNMEGLVTYRFLELNDANYQHVPLDGPSFTQIAHPLASASFVGANSDQDAVVSSCGEPTVQADVAFSGTGPYSLEYSTRGGAGGEPVYWHVDNIEEARTTLNLTLPPNHQGRATVSLLRLRDGKGCERRLATRDLRVDVRRPNAAVGFARQHAVVQEHTYADLPLRLKGTPPWFISYTLDHGRENGTATLHDANEALRVSEPGSYTITGVRDAHCAGSVLPQQETAEVVMRPRPHAFFVDTTQPNGLKSGVVRLPPVCVSTPYTATIALQGQPPVEVKYQQTTLADSGTTLTRGNTLSSSEPNASVPLKTNVPGWFSYNIVSISDAFYPHTAAAAPALLEYRVWPRPDAKFVHDEPQRITACVGGTWERRPILHLFGTPPFQVDMVLRPVHIEGQAVPTRFAQTVHESTWHVMPPTVMSVPGTWELRVERVQDAHCVNEAATASVLVDVVESAGVVPVTNRMHYCVGERMDFVLQGMSPWTVEYTFLGRTSHVTARKAEFWRLADRPGVLSVLGAAHGSNTCRKTHAPIERIVHALPSAHVSAGANLVESLREGGHAEIVFTLEGEPPFSFTYQRTEPADTHARPKVLETHTVNQWQANEYRVPTSQEGTWSVVWMQDRWCQVSLGEVSGPASWSASHESV